MLYGRLTLIGSIGMIVAGALIVVFPQIGAGLAVMSFGLVSFGMYRRMKHGLFLGDRARIKKPTLSQAQKPVIRAGGK